MYKNFMQFAFVLLTLFFLQLPCAYATMLDISINTSVLSGTNAQLAFDFIDGDAVINNTVTVSAFSTDGGLGGSSFDGDVTGTLPGNVTIGDTSFLNTLYQSITLGDSIEFTLTLTDNFAGETLDAFSFSVLDGSGDPLFLTTDPYETDSLFAVDITGAVGGNVQVFVATDTTTPPMTWSVTPTVIPGVVPEPSTFALLSIGLLSLCWSRTRRRS